MSDAEWVALYDRRLEGLVAGRYPRWLPGTTLRDRFTHLVLKAGHTTGVCGDPVMWARVGHPTTERPGCPDCLSLV